MQSRYYNPDWGRFVNADAIVGQPGELLSSNMFVYSFNNPINMSDDTGFRPVFDDEATQSEYDDWAWKQHLERINANNVVQAKLDNEGEANSKVNLHNKDGSVKQERVYGQDGNPLLDTDWNHGGVGHVFPHIHEWKDGVRQDGVPFQGPPPLPKSASRLVVAGTILYWVISEGSRVAFPPRNLIPIP